MASSSSSSVKNSFKYDVFLSFRGEDTRKTFVDHLHLALVNKGIITYKDDQTIEKGERIDDQLIRSIEESRSYIIVFSKNYADSSWCLQELVKIMECQKTKEQTAYPVFYDVEPTEVRNQSGPVGEAFAKHVQNPAAVKWRDALKEASDLAGWELKNTADGHEAEFIQKIVKEISRKLHIIDWSIDETLVGMETRVKNVISSLEIDSEDDVRMIGIWGMGGAGKTTVARAIYDNISIFYEGISFVENVREGSKGMGLKELQRQILSAVLNDRNIDVPGVSDGKNMMKRMMLGRKVLLVLDDVDDIDQLEALAGNSNWFKPGSRIIITTRDKQVLIAHGIHDDNIYSIGLLSDDEAICLFSRRAFRREVPIQGYEEVSRKVVHYAAGLPLTIKVLGSFLCGITDQPKWIDTLERLKTIPLDKQLKKLEISYDGLEKDHKEIFLDVACMLKGEPKDKAICILEGCGFHAQIGLEVLEQRSLINISNYGILGMHDRLEEMGKNIVRRFHPDKPNRHSRLWIKKEIEEILVKDWGTEATRSMVLKNPDIHPAIFMEGLRKMKELRFLCVYDLNFSKKWEIDEGVQYLPDTIRSLHWSHYPLCCLPKTFQANNLVNLEMPHSHISQLWKGGEKKGLEKLKFVNLSYSKLRTFDLGMTRNLVTLNLRNCNEMAELQIPVALPMLNYLDLSHSKVSNLNLGMTPNIEKLRLERCMDLVEPQIPVALLMLKDLDLDDSKVSNLNLGMTPNIEKLRLASCIDLVELQMPVALLMLKELDLSHSKVSNLNLGMTPNINKLRLERCMDLVELQMPVALLMLNYLYLSHSKVSNLNLGMTPNIEKLCLAGCIDLVELHMPVPLLMLKELDLRHSKISNLNLVMAPNIKNFCLEGCHDLVELQMCVTLPMLNSSTSIILRGEETHKTFVDEKIVKGERIDDQLIRSIEKSRSYVIVFSKNHAGSSWYLQKIIECLKTKEHTGRVFYDAGPTKILNQSGAVGEAFAKHVQNVSAGKLKNALKEASNLAGWDGQEAKFIQKVVKEISVKLRLINWCIDKMIVGMETRVKNVISYLEIDSEDDVQMIGIWGVGGGGKTTLAQAVFDHISIWFEGKSFVENVREVSKGSSSGLRELQKQVLNDVLNDQSIDVTSVSDGINKMKKMMPGRKVLIVLDDVDHIKQLEALAGELTWFKPGSRIIITTRDEHLLMSHRVNRKTINACLLSCKEEICLFSRHAFSTEVPNKEFEELSQQVVRYASGVPLLIKVLGSFLCGKTEPTWLDTLKRLETISWMTALDILEISYDGLENDYKDIFLYVACMLNNEPKDKAIKILEGCGFHAQIGLEVLEQKSLISISDNGYLRMHDIIVDMGRYIVSRLHPDDPNRQNLLRSMKKY